MGLKDVAALAEVIVDAARLGLDLGQADVLERYQRWRRFDTMAMGLATDGAQPAVLQPLRRCCASCAISGSDWSIALPPLKSMFIREAAGLTGDVPRLLKGEAL